MNDQLFKNISLTSLSCNYFNTNNDKDYWLIPFPLHGISPSGVVFDKYREYLETIKPNINIHRLVSGDYLKEFINNTDSVQCIIKPYKIKKGYIETYLNTKDEGFIDVELYDQQ